MPKREARFTVRTFECQPNGDIHISALMQHLQELASAHAEELSWGFHQMMEINSYWVLVNFKIEIDRLPRWQESIELQTWPSGHDRLKAFREFVGRTEKGEELFRAGSEWMILSREDNRPRNLKECGFDLSEKGDRIVSEMDRLTPGKDYRNAERVAIPYSSIDLNGHVNNTEYVRWGLDAVKRSMSEEMCVNALQISYLSEIFENDEMDLYVCEEDSTISLLGRRESGGKEIYLMEVTVTASVIPILERLVDLI